MVRFPAGDVQPVIFRASSWTLRRERPIGVARREGGGGGGSESATTRSDRDAAPWYRLLAHGSHRYHAD